MISTNASVKASIPYAASAKAQATESTSEPKRCVNTSGESLLQGRHHQQVEVSQTDCLLSDHLPSIEEGSGADEKFFSYTTNNSTACVAACTLSQWALDFEGNYQRVRESIHRAKAAGAKLRVGAELELSGYGCEDHFLEDDTIEHSWESVAELLTSDLTDDMLCDVGLCALHSNSLRYNCRVWLLNRRVLLVRPKTTLSNGGNYKESRYFADWPSALPSASLEEIQLPACITRVTGQISAPFGVALLQCRDTVVGSAFGEELWNAASGFCSPLSLLGGGAEILCCAAAAHFEVGKYQEKISAAREVTRFGGVCILSNQQGCDGGRLYYDGTAAVCVNEVVVAAAHQFSLEDVQVLTAAVDLADVRRHRAASPAPLLQQQHILQTLRPQQPPPPFFASLERQICRTWPVPVLRADIALCSPYALSMLLPPVHSPPILVSALNTSATAAACPTGGFESLSVAPIGAAPPQQRRLFEPRQHWELPVHEGVPAAEQPRLQYFHQQRRLDQAILIYLCEEEEIAWAAALWLWDYLRRTNARGFFLPLSGGADSAAVAAIVGLMCRAVMYAVRVGQHGVKRDLGRILSLSVCGSSSSRDDAVDVQKQQNPTSDSSTSSPVPEKDEALINFPVDEKELCHSLLFTCYMASQHSSATTKRLSSELAEQLGSYHLAVDIQEITAAFAAVVTAVCGREPRFAAHGGSLAEDLALQNIQARTRMVLAYFMAQLMPVVAPLDSGNNQCSSSCAAEQVSASLQQQEQRRGVDTLLGQQRHLDGKAAKQQQREDELLHKGNRKGSRTAVPFLLLLGTANADEGLRGYFTKYDASSADINPIGSVGKLALRRLLLWAANPETLGYTILQTIAGQAPTAELRPTAVSGEYAAAGSAIPHQTDEADMGMTYEELAAFGKLRKESRCGPLSMFKRLLSQWKSRGFRPTLVAEKVIHFFRQYGRHRHKSCTLTPALHVDPSNAEDSRFDHRPFLYPPWCMQFGQIMRLATDIEDSSSKYKEQI